MAVEVRIEGHGGHITLWVSDYENPVAQDVWDANWLTCGAQLAVDGVSARIEANFTTRDFARFLQQLRRVVDDFPGAALFETDEQALTLRVELGGRGTGTVSGLIQIMQQTRTTVEFSFESDQSFLRPALAELEKLCREFPIKDRSP